MSSTLVDLAARRIIDFERETDGRLLVRLRKDAADLTPYEGQVLDLVRRAARNGVVPADALTAGTDEQAKSFHKSFAKAVTADARQSRLVAEPLESCDDCTRRCGRLAARAARSGCARRAT